MPLEERRRRAEGLRKAVESDDVAAWFEHQLLDMANYNGDVTPEDAESADIPLPPNIVTLTGADRISTTGA